MLLAKSNPPYGLKQHSEDVIASLQRLRSIWCIIPEILDRAALFHDFGKAASGFQKMLVPHGKKWEFRHEVLSAQIFRECHDLTDILILGAYLALLTHHKNLGTNDSVSEEFLACESSSSYSRWPSKWKELQAQELRQLFAPILDNWKYDSNVDSPANDVSQFIKKMETIFDKPLFGYMRGALVAADHIASSQIGNTVYGVGIIKESLEKYATISIPNWEGWNHIQHQAANTKDNAILIAPTGSGKTESALLWALNNRHKYERIFYVLPYQVSINAMAERIAKIFPDGDGHTHVHDNEYISILHANMDLAYLQDAMNDQIPKEKAITIANANKEASRKIYAPIKITTVYQLLDIFFGRKFFEVGILELTDSLVIFDEIHAYDGHTLGLILVLLNTLCKLNARIFIMTATLPKFLQKTLQEAANIPVAHEIQLIATDPLLQEVRRKIILDERRLEEMVEPIRQAAKDAKQQKKKIVVVCNTVRKAIMIWENLKEFSPLLIHSRFTIRDRVQRENKENIQKYDLVISTQVIEVSLDVSFDLMFTELAPVDSLLQRFGRVNRHGKANPANVAPCYIACGEDEGSCRIYDPDLLEQTKQNAPHEPLSFGEACKWIERVYPKGLAKKEAEKMERAKKGFGQVVKSLKPMLDPPSQINNLETTLFDSEQVIPYGYADKWQNLKENGNHLEAKGFVVNVSKQSWNGAKADCLKRGITPFRKVPIEHHDYLIANFQYSLSKGLLLDKPINCYFLDDSQDGIEK